MIESTIRHTCRDWHVQSYDLDEFLRAATDAPPHPLNKSNRHALKNQNPTDVFDPWMGASVVKARAMRTWPAGRAMMTEINLDGCELPRPKTRRRVRCWSDDGDEFDRDRFDAGLDDCWQSRRPRMVSGGSVIKITCEITAPGSIEADSLMWSGLAAARLIDELEGAGYRVEAEACASHRDLDNANAYHCVDIIRVKSASDPLCLDAILLSFSHPAFFRFHCFQAKTRRPVKCRQPGMGWAANTPTQLQGDIHIAKVYDRSSAERLVKSELKKRSAEV